MNKTFTKKEAIDFLEISEKEFSNYVNKSKEIKSRRINGKRKYEKSDLEQWLNLKKSRTIRIGLQEYKKCFEFATKMAYGSKNSYGTGIRGTRSEMQRVDDFILGIIAELGVKKFLSRRFGTKIKLDMKVHVDNITPQDILKVFSRSRYRDCRVRVAVKSSKVKNCFNIIPVLEYDNENRKSDIYIFVRVGLPSDHLFRYLRNHELLKKSKRYLEKNENFRKIERLENIYVWICGYNKHKEFKKVKKIPGQEFQGYRFVSRVDRMHNKDKDWETFIKKL